MENLSRYLAERSSADMIYSLDRLFVGYATFKPIDGDGRVTVGRSGLYTTDFTVAYPSISEAQLAAEALTFPGYENVGVRVYDLRDYRLHVCCQLCRYTVSESGSQVETIQMLRIRTREEIEVQQILQEFRTEALVALALILEEPNPEVLQIYIGDTLPREASKGVYYILRLGVSKAVLR